MLIAPAPPLYFDWRVLTVSSFRANNILRSPVCQSRADLGDPHLFSSVRLSSMCQLSVMRPFWILTRSVAMKGIGWPLPCVCPNLPVKMADEVHMHSDVVAGHDHLLYRDFEVGHGGAEAARGKGGSFRPLRSARRQRV